MIPRALLFAASSLALVLPASAQDTFNPTARAKEAGAAAQIGAGSSVFTQGGIDQNLPIYDGTDTPETGINNGNIDAKTKEAIAGGNSASGAYTDMMDSVELRPKYDLGTDYIGIVNADTATVNAEDIAGQYFTADTTENPACNFSDFSVLEPFERYCDVHANIKDVGCRIDRVVEIDRLDTWRCDITREDTTVRCETDLSGACDPAVLPDSQPGVQCSVTGEQCLAWQELSVREPAEGGLYEDEQFGWRGSIFFTKWKLYWEGAVIAEADGRDPPATVKVNGWTYEAGAPLSGTFVYKRVQASRFREAETREPPAGAFVGLSDGGLYAGKSNPKFYGWKGKGTAAGQLTWAGENLGSRTPGVKIGDCTYTRLEIQTEGAWSGVYRTCPAQPRCLEYQRDYRCTSVAQCGALQEAQSCAQTARNCLAGTMADCDLERLTYACSNDLTDYAPARHVSSTIERIEDKLVNSCNPDPAEEGCIAGETVCTAGKQVRTVNGFPISRDCWQYEKSYSCIDSEAGSYTDCGPFKTDSSCKVISQTCLSYDDPSNPDNGECLHWEYGYRCGGGMELPESCTASNVCVGDLCEGIVDEPNTDFANASAWLTMLDEAAKDSEKSVDMQDVQLFAGAARNCKVGALGTINCCKDSGWANGILGDCSESELTLMDRIQAKAAVYIGTYCAKRVLGVCLQKRRSYCTFNSQLGMVFQKEIRRLAGTGWGSVKDPNCAGLPLDEIGNLDWDQIDLSEAFEDMMNDANVPTTAMVTDYLRDRLSLTSGQITDGD
ncbi:conjugal transfer protein TraN [Phaeovulum sp. W22_SRMD_FR3]